MARVPGGRGPCIIKFKEVDRRGTPSQNPYTLGGILFSMKMKEEENASTMLLKAVTLT